MQPQQSWKVQLTEVLQARWRVKRRTKGAIFMDFLLPIYMIAIFIAITAALKNESYPLNEDYRSTNIPFTYGEGRTMRGLAQTVAFEPQRF